MPKNVGHELKPIPYIKQSICEDQFQRLDRYIMAIHKRAFSLSKEHFGSYFELC